MSPAPIDFNPKFWLKELGARLAVAKIIGYEYKIDAEGMLIHDENQNLMPTGAFQIELLDRASTKARVLAVFSMVGNSAFAGGLPEIGSLCIVGFRENNTAVILGFLPIDLPDLNLLRGEVPTLFPGEYMIQGSDSYEGAVINDTPELGPTTYDIPQFFSGARVKWDKYARLVIQARDCEIVYGPILTAEYTADVKFVQDPITGVPMIFRQKFLGGKVESRVDNQGNATLYCTKDLHLIVDGELDLQVKNLNLGGISKSGIEDQHGNRIKIEEDSDANEQLKVFGGDVTVKSVRGNTRVQAGANVLIHSGGNIEEVALRSKTETVTDVLTVTVGKEMQEVVGTNKKEYVGLNKETIVLGKSGESVVGSKAVNVTGSYGIQVAGVLTIQAAKVKIEAVDIELGAVATQKIVKQIALTAKYNAHIHDGGGSGPPQAAFQLVDIPLTGDFNDTVKVGP